MNPCYSMDTSAWLSAWKTIYPKAIFPSLWDKLALKNSQFFLIRPAWKEFKLKNDDDNELQNWLSANHQIITLSKEDEKLALNLESKYETNNTSRGAGSTDIKLIAQAKQNGMTVVTQESWQNQNPEKKCNYKIPLICKEESVKCINFVCLLGEIGISI